MTNSKKQLRRVVVTGLGVVSSLGIGWEEFWKNLIAGKSGISKIQAFDTSDFDSHYAGEIKNFDPYKYISKRKIIQFGRASQMAIAASKLAFKDAQLFPKELSSNSTGVAIGTTMGESQILEIMNKALIIKGANTIRPYMVPQYPADNISANVARELKLSGNNLIFANACAAGNYSLGHSYDLIRNGRQDFMLAGGVDALSRIAFTGFIRLFAMAPEKCQPFDKNRKGMILGEGAGILVLETLENAVSRNAKIYAEILGYGLSCDASHMTIPSVAGIVSSIRKSLRDSNIAAEEVDYISAHGTGTIENDKAECKAFKLIFGKSLDKIPVSSIKSMLGHIMGAASALESITCCLVVQNNQLPPTINFCEPDSECNIDCVPNQGREDKCNLVLNNSQAFGGNNVCIIFRKL